MTTGTFGALELTLKGGNTVTVHGVTPQESYEHHMKYGDAVTRARYPAHKPADCDWCTWRAERNG